MAVNFALLYQKYEALADDINRRINKFISNILAIICIVLAMCIIYNGDNDGLLFLSMKIGMPVIDNLMYIAFEETRFLYMNKIDDYKEQIKLFYHEINHIISLVEILELNNRIWTKK